jgi:hypothetical protein
VFAPSRDQARQFFFDTWAKYRAGAPLEGLETTLAGLILQHPEYHRLLDERDRNIDRDFGPEQGGLNPFLHLSLHLAVEEQLSIDQPAGIAHAYREQLAQLHDVHEAKHVLLECLGEAIWNAQRSGAALDGEAYLRLVRDRIGPP